MALYATGSLSCPRRIMTAKKTRGSIKVQSARSGLWSQIWTRKSQIFYCYLATERSTMKMRFDDVPFRVGYEIFMYRSRKSENRKNINVTKAEIQECIENSRTNLERVKCEYKQMETGLKPGSDSLKKPTFPSYVPSHMQTNNKSNNKKNNDDEIYEFCQLYVTNLPQNTNMQEINNMFPYCIGIALGVNEENESHAAYVEFLTPQEAEEACDKTRGATLRGNTLIVSPKLKFN